MPRLQAVQHSTQKNEFLFWDESGNTLNGFENIGLGSREFSWSKSNHLKIASHSMVSTCELSFLGVLSLRSNLLTQHWEFGGDSHIPDPLLGKAKDRLIHRKTCDQKVTEPCDQKFTEPVTKNLQNLWPKSYRTCDQRVTEPVTKKLQNLWPKSCRTCEPKITEPVSLQVTDPATVAVLSSHSSRRETTYRLSTHVVTHEQQRRILGMSLQGWRVEIAAKYEGCGTKGYYLIEWK
jgi:hypothetical protein